MQLDISQFHWIRQPMVCDVTPDRVCVTTQPGTDLWQRTYYGFQNDNAPILQMKTREQFFSFVVKTEFSSACHRYDQCGIAVYLDSENWLKASVECENEMFQRLGSVVTNRGYSDWATTDIPGDVKTMWYRLSRRGADFCVESSADGVQFRQMRICHLEKGAEEISLGIYACSPENSSFEAVFTDMALLPCQWHAHE